MPALTTAALRKQIAAGETGPLYLLVGGDDVEKSAVAGEFVEMVDEGLRAFNVDRLYGGEIKVDDLADTAATLPMMAPRRIVVVLAAERLFIPKREGKAADAEQERLEVFLRKPPSHATVVFVFTDPPDKRRRAIKLLRDTAAEVDCGTIADDADAERWVKARAAKDKAPLDAAAVRALVDRVGADVKRLRAGLERVALYGYGQPVITAEDVRQCVPSAIDTPTQFGIADAIKTGNASRALAELGLALENGTSEFMLLGQVRWAVEQLPSPRLGPGIEAVFRTDQALKSSGGDPRILLERLVVELCGTRGASRTRPPAFVRR
jgi:DNA polymerase-3 subunit delta